MATSAANLNTGLLGEFQESLSANLPDDWEFTTLGEAFKWGSGGTPKRTNPDFYGGNIPWLIIGDLDDGVVTEAKTCITDEGIAASSAKLVKEGSVLLAMYGSIGKLGIAGRELTTNQAIAFTKPEEDDAKYLFYYLMFVRNKLARLGKGATQKNISQTVIKAFPYVRAPAEQQSGIVSEIEKQFSRLDEAVASLKRVKANLKRYKAAVLKAAVEGKLTEEWRKQNPDVEPASKLLERILAERRTKWEEAQLAKMKAKGKEPKDDRWKEKYKGPIAVAAVVLPKLPSTWAWATVDQLAAPEKGSITDGPFGSNLKTAHYTDEGPRVIRLQNIGYGEWFDEKAHISNEHFQSLIKHSVISGDVLVASLGDPAPRACLVPDGIGDAIVKADCIRVRSHSVVSADYLVHALSSWGTQRRTTALIHGVGRPRLNMTEIKSIALPVPPITEHIEICKVIEEKWSILDSIEQDVSRQLSRAELNRQSILATAFCGSLVWREIRREGK